MGIHIAFLYTSHGKVPPDNDNIKIYHISRELLRRGHRVTWVRISPPDNLLSYKMKEGEIKLWQPKPSGLRYLGTVLVLRRILRFLKKEAVDVLYGDDWFFFRGRFPWAILLQIMLRSSGIRFASDLRDPFVDYEVACGRLREKSIRTSWARFHAGITYRLSDFIFVPSEAYKQTFISDGVAEEKIHSIYGGADPEKFHLKVDSSPVREQLTLEQKFVIGWFGLLHAFRNVREILLPLVEQIPSKLPEAVFLFAGKGALMTEFAERLKEKAHAVYLGFIPYDKLPAYVSACDVTLCPINDQSRFGRLSLWRKIGESIGVGVPIIATRTPATEMQFGRYRSVILVENKLEAFEKALLQLSIQRDEYKAIAAGDARDFPYNMQTAAFRIVNILTGEDWLSAHS